MAITENDLEVTYREWLKDLCGKLDKYARDNGIPSTIAAQIVARECMYMASYFVAHGSTISVERFAADCASMLQWNRDHPPEGVPSAERPPTLN